MAKSGPHTTLGRHVQHDPRSKSFHAARAVAIKDVMWEYHGQILDQGRVGSCTGNSAVEVLMTGPYYDHYQKVYTEADALAIYERATHLDSIPGYYPPNDTGSSGLAVMKACKEKGWIGGYRHAFGLTHALQALMLGPVIAGTAWYENMFNPTPDGFVRVGGAVAGGHEYTVIGYDSSRDAVRCINHWTASWGDHGYFWLKRSDWGNLLADYGDVTVPVIPPAPPS
jgi:hypothetical protein